MARSQAIETAEDRQEVLDSLLQYGLDQTIERLGLAEDVIFQVLVDGGMPEGQATLLFENSQFRTGTFTQGSATISPDLAQSIENVRTIAADAASQINNAVTPVLDNFGQTPDTSQAGDRFTDIAQGRLPGQIEREDTARTILSHGGQTRGTSVIIDRGTDILNSHGTVGMNDLLRSVRTSADIVATGGETDKTNALFQFGAGLLESHGFTPEVQEVFNFALESLNNGTSSPELDAAIAKVNGIIDSEGLQGAGILPLTEFLGFARADAANTSMQLARAAQTDAVRRGLITGPVTNSGAAEDIAGEGILQNEGATTYAAVSENQRLRAGAVSDAFGNLTQLLALQRNDPNVGAFAGLLGDSIRTSAANMQTGAQLGVDAAGLENERLNIGLMGVLQGSSIFANREANAFNSVLGASQLETGRVGMANDMLANLTNERLAGASGLLQTNNQEMGNFFNAINATLGASNQNINANIANSNTLLTNQQQAFNAFLTSLGLSGDLVNSGQNTQMQGAQLLSNNAIPFLNFGNSAMTQSTQMAQQEAQIRAQPAWWMNLINSAIPAAVNAVIPGIAGLGGNNSSGGGYSEGGNYIGE